MDVILPYLIGRINPRAAEKPPRLQSAQRNHDRPCRRPGRLTLFNIGFCNRRLPYEHPLVAPQPMHFKQVPFLTIINRLHS
jgi:hypothetical protein